MPARITYVYHDCFLLDHGGLTILFDYPSQEHRNAEAAPLVQAHVQDADLVVFFSHSHPDHFSEEVLELEKLARRVRYVVSFDVADLYEAFDPDESGREVYVLDPDDTEAVTMEAPQGELSLRCFESSDLGVGALIELPGARIWFGGDVAAWDWENADEATREFSRRHFDEVLDALAVAKPDIAFSNTDKRLENWAGGLEFVRRVRPRVFVPMHAFGNAEWVWEFAAELGDSPSKLFLYASTGDAMEVAL